VCEEASQRGDTGLFLYFRIQALRFGSRAPGQAGLRPVRMSSSLLVVQIRGFVGRLKVFIYAQKVCANVHDVLRPGGRLLSLFLPAVKFWPSGLRVILGTPWRIHSRPLLMQMMCSAMSSKVL
jgi:hypothetical protein